MPIESTWTEREKIVRETQWKESGDPSENFLGRIDRRFLSGKSEHGMFPLSLKSHRIQSVKRAIAVDDLEFLTDRLNEGYDPNSLTSNGESMLHIAVLKQSPETIRLLLKFGATFEIRIPFQESLILDDSISVSEFGNAGGATALHYACGTGNLEIVKLLVENKEKETGALEIGTDESCGTPLVWAIACGSIPVVNYLIDNGVNVHCRDSEQNTTAMIALLSLKEREQRSQLHEILETLFRAGVDINARNAAGLSLYDLAQDDELRDRILQDKGKSAKPESIDHLFSWNLEASRREWPYQGKDRVLIIRD